MNTPTGTECNNVYQTDEEEFNPTNEPTIYETDEEEFSETRSTELVTDHKVSVTAHIPATGAPKCRKTAKRKVVVPARNRKKCQGYNLGYLNLWWNRMGHEAKREEEDRKRKEEEARRKEHVKKWLRSKKVKREENKKKVKSSREGGKEPFFLLSQGHINIQKL